MDNSSSKRSKDRAFYEPPKNASVNIINDARQSIGIRSVKEIKTNRPFTPREERRTLFGTSSFRNPETRPPSAYSLGSKHFEGTDSRPPSGAKLLPLNHVPKTPAETEIESVLLPPKPPPDGNKLQRKGSRSNVLYAVSVDAGRNQKHIANVEAQLPIAFDGESLQNQSESDIYYSNSQENVLPTEERGEGDGKEMPHRASSSASVCNPSRSDVSKDSRKGSESYSNSEGTRTSSAGSSGRAGSAGKKESEESAEEAKLFSLKIEPLLEAMTMHSKNHEGDKLAMVTDQLFNFLDKENLLGKNCRHRSSILKSVFKLLDVEEPRLLIKLARLILGLKVSGNNLTSICKLIFKVSRNEKNDLEFLQGNFLDLLIESLKCTDLNTCSEALIYSIGALKLLSGNSSIVKHLVKKDFVDVLGSVMAGINKVNRENGKINEQYGHILVQLTAALRNSADSSLSKDKLNESKLVDSLCCVTETYSSDSDLMLNISRIFSKMTLHRESCVALAVHPNSFRAFVHLLNQHISKPDMIVRICFILGNLTARNDEARVRLFYENGSLDSLLMVLKNYLVEEIKVLSCRTKRKNQSEECKDSKIEDVLIKVVRVIANLSINESIGTLLACNEQVLFYLLDILDVKEMPSSDELVINTVSTINNLSFYTVKNSAICANYIRIIDVLLTLLSADNMEGMIEASRVFGNLTRQKTVRDYLSINKVDQMMITMLDSGNREVVFIACGVLINFMVDDDKRTILKKEGGIRKLIEVLRDFGRTDWDLSSLVCQTLWNYSVKITSSSACFGEQESQDLVDLLLEFTDESIVVREEVEEEMRDYYLESWKDFSVVGEQLLQRIEDHQSDLEPLENPLVS